MKVVIAHRTGQPRVVELPEPKCSTKFVTVRVSHSALALPDEMQQLELVPKLVRKGEDGIPIGSGASGTIMEVGPGVESLKAGLRVAVYGHPYVYHGTQLVVPESHVVELPKKVNHEEGAFAGQGAIALHLMRLGKVQLGETVLIFGGDLLGLLLAQVVRAAGATPIVVDDSEYRLGKGRAVGIQYTHQRPDDQLVRTVASLTDENGVDVAVLTRREDPAAFASALRMLRQGGTIVVGAGTQEIADLSLIREKEACIVSGLGPGPAATDPTMSFGAHPYPRTIARWTHRDNMACFASLLAERKVQISPLVSDRTPLERANMAYEKAARSRDSYLAVVLTV
jgi:threonine dehydrogenase-like Zn-dependent dehydrogenase